MEFFRFGNGKHFYFFSVDRYESLPFFNVGAKIRVPNRISVNVHGLDCKIVESNDIQPIYPRLARR
jgi:hypothetical protein